MWEKSLFTYPHLALLDTHVGEGELGSEGQPPSAWPMEKGVRGLTQGPTDVTSAEAGLGSATLQSKTQRFSPLSHTLPPPPMTMCYVTNRPVCIHGIYSKWPSLI